MTDLAAEAEQLPLEVTPWKLRAALHRDVRALPIPHRYVVSGLADDLYPRYVVRWDPAEPTSHHCTCYENEADANGEAVDPPPDGCAHVVAAHLYQRKEQARRDLAAAREAEMAAALLAGELDQHGDDEGELIPLPSDPILNQPPEPPFPDWVQAFRHHQWEAVERVMACYDDGAQVVMLQAPPGTGKTLLAESVRRLVQGTGLYVCSTKTLQDQAARDFPYARVLKGRANYPTLSGGVQLDDWGRAVASPAGAGSNDQVTAADCTATATDPQCRFCDPISQCPYRLARARAQTSRFAILNTSYFLTDVNKAGRLFKGRDLAIFDEADLLEGELLNMAEVKISAARMKKLRMAPPPRKTVADTWLPWVLNEAIPRVRDRLRGLPSYEAASTGQIRERKGLAQLAEDLHDLAAGLPAGGWVYDGYDRGDVIFRPVEVSAWGRWMLWPHAERFLLMSGTIISDESMADSLGLDGGWRLVDVPMTFAAENRQIRIVGMAEVTAKNQEISWPKIAEGVAGVLALHPDERVLVHTVSYPLAIFLMKDLARRGVRRPLVSYSNSRERDGALARYKATPGAVLLAPSMDRGVDLPGDLCRVVVIAKVPYPNLGDKRTSARLYGTSGGEAWYSVNTVRTIVQMTGRGVRSAEDRAVTYVLDHSFTSNLWRKNRGLLPSWWIEGIDRRGVSTRRLQRAARELCPDLDQDSTPNA